MDPGCTDSDGDLGMVVDHQTDPGRLDHGQDGLGEPPDLSGGCTLGPQLDEVGPSLAQRRSDGRGIAPVEVGGIDEGVEPTIVDRRHDPGMGSMETRINDAPWYAR